MWERRYCVHLIRDHAIPPALKAISALVPLVAAYVGIFNPLQLVAVSAFSGLPAFYCAVWLMMRPADLEGDFWVHRLIFEVVTYLASIAVLGFWRLRDEANARELHQKDRTIARHKRVGRVVDHHSKNAISQARSHALCFHCQHCWPVAYSNIHTL